MTFMIENLLSNTYIRFEIDGFVSEKAFQFALNKANELKDLINSNDIDEIMTMPLDFAWKSEEIEPGKFIKLTEIRVDKSHDYCVVVMFFNLEKLK